LPDKKTAYSSAAVCKRWTEIFKPASVFPAPGTPVTKQIDFLRFLLEESMISEI
jgi:hypothetical protein